MNMMFLTMCHYVKKETFWVITKLCLVNAPVGAWLWQVVSLGEHSNRVWFLEGGGAQKTNRQNAPVILFSRLWRAGEGMTSGRALAAEATQRVMEARGTNRYAIKHSIEGLRLSLNCDLTLGRFPHLFTFLLTMKVSYQRTRIVQFRIQLYAVFLRGSYLSKSAIFRSNFRSDFRFSRRFRKNKTPFHGNHVFRS